MTTLTADKLIEKGNRTLDWAAGVLKGPDGYRGCEDKVFGYYKSVIAFAAGGRVREARMVASYLKSHFYDAGTFDRADDPTAGGPTYYRNAWIARGLHRLGRYDMSFAAGDLLEQKMDAATGGLPAQSMIDKSIMELDWGSTGSAALAFMTMGRWAAANRAADFLLNMLQDQPDTKGMLYLRRNLDGTLVKEVLVDNRATSYSINIGEPKQYYWYLGIAMHTFADLYLASGEEKWRDACYLVLEYIANCNEDIYEIVSNGKVAWGLGAMYRATGDAAIQKKALDVWAWHFRIQEPDGRWLRVGQYPTVDEQPLHITLDTSLERGFYMFELTKTLDL